MVSAACTPKSYPLRRRTALPCLGTRRGAGEKEMTLTETQTIGLGRKVRTLFVEN